MRFLLPSAAVLLLSVVATDANLIISPPLTGKSGPERLLIIINGAFVANTHYQEIGQEIQKQSSDIQLWVAIPSFIADCPNPGEISTKITDAVANVQSQGFKNMNASSDVIISGHSLGGIFSQGVVASGGYAALVLFGSYLTTGNSLKSFEYPVLTLAGEVDGLTRITRIAKEWEGMQARIATDGPDAKYRFPVIALAGQSHSQFCSGVNVTAFGHKDIRPDVSWPTAHAAIAKAVANFLTLVASPTDRAARAYIDQGLQYTGSLMAGWLEAQLGEGEWCAAAQEVNAARAAPHGAFHINTSVCSNFASFGVEFPSINAGAQQVKVVTELQHRINVGDSSVTDVAATEIDCKLMSAKAIAKAFGTGNVSTAGGCQAANDAAVQYAMSLVSEATKARYLKEGKPFLVEEDSQYHTGITWQSSGFTFQSEATHVKVQSPLLATGSDVLCKLVSPSRIVEYMMVDGLPRFDGTVP